VTYFGQPLSGFVFWSDFFIAERQLPLIFKVSGLGPGVAFALAGLSLFFSMVLCLAFKFQQNREWRRTVLGRYALGQSGTEPCIGRHLSSDAPHNL
jgi:hypothetical protein